MYFTYKHFATILNAYRYDFSVGDIIAGTIFSKEIGGYLVDIGGKTIAYLPFNEVYLNGSKRDLLEIGDVLELFVLAHNEELQQLILSLRRLAYLKAWDRIRQLKAEDATIEVQVSGINKGGVLIYIEDVQGFIPNSHLSYMVNINDLNNYYVPCKFLIADEPSNKLVLSNRCAILERLIPQIHIGKVYHSVVTEIKVYGIIVNIHGIPALLHVSEVGIDHVSNLNELFTVGDDIIVRIIHIDTEKGRLSVSRHTIVNG
jgi:small subunit ribosomal protein S1